MKNKLLLLKSTANKSCHERIWWTYNYGAGSENQMSDRVAEKLSEAIDYFIDEIFENYEQLTEEQLHFRMKAQVETLCQIYPTLLEDTWGLYDYGGLNEFFGDIVECFPFYVREKYCNDVGMLFDCLNGEPIKDE